MKTEVYFSDQLMCNRIGLSWGLAINVTCQMYKHVAENYSHIYSTLQSSDSYFGLTKQFIDLLSNRIPRQDSIVLPMASVRPQYVHEMWQMLTPVTLYKLAEFEAEHSSNISSLENLIQWTRHNVKLGYEVNPYSFYETVEELGNIKTSPKLELQKNRVAEWNGVVRQAKSICRVGNRKKNWQLAQKNLQVMLHLPDSASWEGSSVALIARGFHDSSAVLDFEGAHVGFELGRSAGSRLLRPFADAPNGLSIWEGCTVFVLNDSEEQYREIACDSIIDKKKFSTTLCGAYRSLTREEIGLLSRSGKVFKEFTC